MGTAYITFTICTAWSSVKLCTKAWFDFNNKKIKKGAKLPHFATFFQVLSLFHLNIWFKIKHNNLSYVKKDLRIPIPQFSGSHCITTHPDFFHCKVWLHMTMSMKFYYGRPIIESYWGIKNKRLQGWNEKNLCELKHGDVKKGTPAWANPIPKRQRAFIQSRVDQSDNFSRSPNTLETGWYYFHCDRVKIKPLRDKSFLTPLNLWIALISSYFDGCVQYQSEKQL